MLEHGGRLREAAGRWNIPLADWLDLSTGISPWSYPLPPPPVEIWQRLPEEDDGLETVARAYYGAQHIAVVPGSQAAIQRLPAMLPPGRVAMPTPLYGEHPAAWQAGGHEVVGWEAPADYAVLCNPSNPTGQVFSRRALIERALGLRLLVVDEAFIDADSTESLAALAGSGVAGNIVVLRSLGKFFGLAGARLGFAIAAPALLARLAESMGPWAVSHPARWAGRRALADHAWQDTQRRRLGESSLRLATLLRDADLGEPTGTAFFQYVVTPRAVELHEALARRGILVRKFDVPEALRFGLPGDESGWRRLADCLADAMRQRRASPAVDDEWIG